MGTSSALLTDLYELTMAAGYFETGLDLDATFELWVRRLPEERSFLVVSGVERAVDFLENLRFTDEEIRYLESLAPFANVSPDFFRYLGQLRFTGDLDGVPEGGVVFAGEPILRVTAPILQAQIVETFLLAAVSFETMIASKAARVVSAAMGDGRERSVSEFGSRRAHGPDAGQYAARAAYVGGCASTSNVLAGLRFGAPVVGTMAHSWIMAHEAELGAYQAYHRIFADSTVLLIDTYDTLEGARLACRIGPQVKAVRLDSGDLEGLARKVRRILDEGGLKDTQIFLSGDLNEYKIAELIRRGTPVDSFGVGTELSTSCDAPKLDAVYKLVQTRAPDGAVRRPVKLSSGKVVYPTPKAVYRFCDDSGACWSDVVMAADEPAPEAGRPLLEPLMRGGRRVREAPPLQETRARALAEMANLPERFKRLHGAEPYPVRVSPALEKLLEQARREVEVRR